MTSLSVRERFSALAASLAGQFSVVCLFLSVVFAIRLPSRLSGGFLWGEDTAVFMRAAYETGVSSLIAPYADYLHTLPRLLAYVLAHTTAITSTPYTYVYACLLLYAASASYLYRVALRYHGGRRFAAAMAAAPFLVAQSGEVYLSITNLQWIAAVVLLAMVWDTFTPCTARRAWPLRLAILAVLVMTGPFAVFFSPVFAAILWHNRRHLNNYQALSALAVCLAAGLIQLAMMASALTAAAAGPAAHGWAEFGFGYQFMHNFVTELFVPRALIGNWWPFAAGLLVFGLVVAAALTGARLVCWTLLALALLLWMIGVYRSNTPTMEVHWYGHGARYLFVPYIFVAWAMLIALVTIRPHWRWLPGVLLAAMLITSLDHFHGSRWTKWSIETAGDRTYRLKVPPGWETVVVDRLRQPAS